MATTIPDKFYVTIQYRADASTESGLLGFASPYTKDAAFEKRRATQESWAYGGYGSTFIIREDESIIAGPDCKVDKFVLFATKCYPIIIKNEPLAGFEIAKSVRRSGWNGSGNVVWRLADPRGFELEITSDNFAKVIDCCTMINGVIREKCVWGRDGSKNILLPITSEPYQTAFAQTNLIKNKVSFKEVKLGDHVTLIDKTEKSGHRDGIYMGRMFAVTAQNGTHSRSDSGYWDSNIPNQYLTNAVVDKYIFREIDSDEMFAITKPVVGAIVTKAAIEGVLLYNIQEANDQLSLGNKISGLPGNTVLLLQKASDLSTVKTELVDTPTPSVNGKFPEADVSGTNYYHDAELFLVTKNDKDWYLTANASKDRDYKNSKAALFGVDIDKLQTNEFCVKAVTTQRPKDTRYGYYYNNTMYYDTEATDLITTFDITEYKAKSLWLTDGKLRARVFTVPGYTGNFVRQL